ncbi:helix-turn-helix domain-containing protein [Alteromonas sp. H39]|uniref:helix-turn-helix domain-containing protein n=1 Tax=Alteromonas sp. H39 TaxID=3389876 RepID=UPI0039E0ACDD
MDHSHINQNIARQLKARRKDKGWSLDKTAQTTGVSKAMLGQIERGESSPTIATLWKIATGLSCSFSTFITHENRAIVETSKRDGDAFANDPNMQVKTLFAYDPSTGFEVFEITLTNNHTQLSDAHQQGVKEHIHVLEGELQLAEGDDWFTLATGEQSILKADRPHGYRAVGSLTRFLDIIYYPQS